MAQKVVWLPEVGELTLSKRRGTKNIRLSVTSTGKVRVGLPAWAPYSMGISFAKKRSDWIQKHLQNHSVRQLANGDRIGKSYRLSYEHIPQFDKTSTRIGPNAIRIKSNLPLADNTVQKRVTAAAERALKLEALRLLPPRLDEIARRYDYSYGSVRIKKLASRWGSCSSQNDITLNYFLMQLPWALVDYVIIHELVHTKHLNHGPDFWAEFERVYPGAKQFRKQIKDYRPAINSLAPSAA